MSTLYRSLWLVLVCVNGAAAWAQPTLYPHRAGIIDLTQPPYSVDPTGLVDAAPGINQAMDDFNDMHAILYLPAGTYRVSQTIEWGEHPNCGSYGGCRRYTVLAGAGESQTILKLDDNHPDYQDPNATKLMVNTGTSAAFSFENGLRHLTVDTGIGNPGVDAVGFQANNNGGIFHVTIRSGDGQGRYGLHLGIGVQIGPCLFKHVTVDGFRRGVVTYGNQNHVVFEHLTLRNQTEYGFYNRQQISTIRDLQSTNSVPAIYNQGDGGSTVTLLDSQLTGTGSAAGEIAIRNNNRRNLLVRNVQVSGYALAVQELQNGFQLGTVPTGYIAEYTSRPPDHLCDNVLQSLGLPIQETPDIAYADTADWVSVADYGAQIDNGFQGQGSAQDDTPAFQAALNSGASTVVVPSPRGRFPARYMVYGDLIVPPTVKRIIGSKGKMDGTYRFVVQAGSDPLVIEDFAKVTGIYHAGARPLVVRHMTVGKYESLPGGGSGTVYFEDVNGNDFTFHQQSVWARQFNLEGDGQNVLNDGGTLWVMGVKTERKGNIFRTINGGTTEVLGMFVYSTKTEESPPKPIFIVEESNMSVGAFHEVTYINDPYDIVLRETRNGITYELGDPGSIFSSTLLVAYPSTAPNVPPTVLAGDDQVLTLPALSTQLQATVNDDAQLSGGCYVQRNWTVTDGPAGVQFADATDPITTVTFPEAGIYTLRLTANDGAFTVFDELTVRVFDTYSSTLDHDRDGLPSGTGADAPLRGWSNYLNNYGASTDMGVRNYSQFPAKAIVRIDRSALGSTPVDHAAFELEISTTNTGLIDPWTYNVFGLNDGHTGEDWVEGTGTGQGLGGAAVTYDNAPGFSAPHGGTYDPATPGSGGVDHTHATFLGTFTLRANRREKRLVQTDALRDFVNQDTDGQLTFLLTRVSNANNTIGFATKEHPTFAAPRLYVDYGTAALPVVWSAVGATAESPHVSITWATGWEMNNAGFVVEHRQSGAHFHPLATVDARDSGGSYRYLHRNAGWGVHHYRIRQTDLDGTVQYSQVVAATLMPSPTPLTVVPNPVSIDGRSWVNWPVTDGPVRLTLTDAGGRLLWRAEHDNIPTLPYALNLYAYPPGIYQLRVHTSNNVYTTQVQR